jgi:hypothetical protein
MDERPGESSRERKAVFILEDQSTVLKSLVDALNDALPDIYTFGATSIDDAWIVIGDAEKNDYSVVVVVVDQARQTGPEPDDLDYEWGLDFLRKVKKDYPSVFRILFSTKTRRRDFATVLEEELIHHFVAKDEFRTDAEFQEAVTDHVRGFTEGRNVGNVKHPLPDPEFVAFMQQWIASLPNRGQTPMRFLDGREIVARQIVEEPDLLEAFRKAFASNWMRGYVVKKKEPSV